MSASSNQRRNPNRLPPRRGREVVPISQVSAALRWSTARVRAVDDLLKPLRLPDGTRLYHVDRALTFIRWIDDLESWSAERGKRDRREQKRNAAQNLPLVRREVNASDPAGLLRIGAPPDEYESEIREIVGWLPYLGTERQVQFWLHRTFTRQFKPCVPGPLKMYAPLAKALFEGRRTHLIFAGAGRE